MIFKPGDVVEIVGQYGNKFWGEVGMVEEVYLHVRSPNILVYFAHREDLHNGNSVLKVNKPTNQYWWLSNHELLVVTPAKLLDLEEML
jgi:hypothetical protein